MSAYSAQARSSPLSGTKAAAAAAMIAVMYGLAAVHFLVFHTIAELFSIVVAFTAFGVAWYSRTWIGANFLLLLGISQFFVGMIDIAHTLVYKGMGVVPMSGAGLSTQFWIAARIIEAAAYLIAVARPAARFSPLPVFLTFAIISGTFVTLIITGLFPDCYVDGQGLTPFKIGMEYTIVGVLVVTLTMLRRNAREIDPQVRLLLSLCIGAKIVSELAFTLYIDPYGVSNFVGHILKIVSSYFFLSAIVETGLKRPQAMIFGSLEREKNLADEVQRHAVTLDAVLDSSPDPVVMISADGCFRFASRASESFFSMAVPALAGRNWRDLGLSPEIMLPIEELRARVLEGAGPVTAEYSIGHGVDERCLEVQVSPVRLGDENPSAVVAIIRDVTTRSIMERQLKESLADNQSLMMEVHHRVKNNLQIVSSILQMQGWRVQDQSVRDQFDEACGRILSLAKVHEMLYKQDNASAVDFAAYIQTLCGELITMYGVRSDKVAVKVSGGNLTLSLDRAVPLGLIIHELITNCIKHAFGDKSGEINISVSAYGADSGLLVVSDNGNGFAAKVGPDAESLGMRMVSVLVKQIDGTIDIEHDGGSRVSVKFPLAPSDA